MFEAIKQSFWFPHVLLLFIQLFASGWHIIGSLALKGGADPIIFALYREITASVLMYGFTLIRKKPILIEKTDWPRFCFLGLCSFLNVVFTVLCLQYIAASKYAMFQPIIPCIATLISIVLRQEKISILKILGIFLAVGGAITIEAWKTSNSNPDSNPTLGLILVIFQVFGMACLIVFQKPMVSKYDSSVVTFVYYSLGSLLTVLVAICWYSRFTVQSLYFSGLLLPWLALVYVSIFATLYSYNAYSYVGKILPPSTTTIYITCQPIATVLLSLAILGSVLSLSEGVGGSLVLLGLGVTVYSQSREPRDRDRGRRRRKGSLEDPLDSCISSLTTPSFDAADPEASSTRPFSSDVGDLSLHSRLLSSSDPHPVDPSDPSPSHSYSSSPSNTSESTKPYYLLYHEQLHQHHRSTSASLPHSNPHPHSEVYSTLHSYSPIESDDQSQKLTEEEKENTFTI